MFFDRDVQKIVNMQAEQLAQKIAEVCSQVININYKINAVNIMKLVSFCI
jgi:hypothetical protein